MKEKFKRYRKIIFYIIALIIIIFILIQSKGKTDFRDDLIFFKFFGEGQKSSISSNFLEISNNLKSTMENKENQSTKQYYFNVSYKNVDFKEINLSDTINSKTLVNEKVAPGTSGSFEIVVSSNQNLDYKIKFNSKNEKPKNLIFYVGDNESNSLEGLEKILTGRIEATTIKRFNVNWKWDYNNKNDIQDTLDGKNIRQYKFDIYTIAEEM